VVRVKGGLYDLVCDVKKIMSLKFTMSHIGNVCD